MLQEGEYFEYVVIGNRFFKSIVNLFVHHREDSTFTVAQLEPQFDGFFGVLGRFVVRKLFQREDLHDEGVGLQFTDICCVADALYRAHRESLYLVVWVGASVFG